MGFADPNPRPLSPIPHDCSSAYLLVRLHCSARFLVRFDVRRDAYLAAHLRSFLASVREPAHPSLAVLPYSWVACSRWKER